MINEAINTIEDVYMSSVKLGAGLIILMAVNIVLGTVNSLFEKNFQKELFLKGIGKTIVLIFCFIAVYVAGIINRETLAIDLGQGTPPIDIVDAMHALLLAGYYSYSKKVFLKFKDIVCPDGPVGPPKPEPIPLDPEPIPPEPVPIPPEPVPVPPEPDPPAEEKYKEMANEEEGEYA